MQLKRTFYNNERKFYKQVGGYCKKTYKQPDIEETNQILV